MTAHFTKRGLVIQATLGTLAIASLVGVSTFHLASSFPDTLPEKSFVFGDTSTAMPPSEFRILLGSAGIDADSLSAAGVTMNQIDTIVKDAREHLVAYRDALHQARESMNTAERTAHNLDRALRAGTATDDQKFDAQTTLNAADATANGYRNAVAELRNAALATISEDAKANLALVRANANWDVPHAYRLAERSESEWVQLRKALITEKTASRKEIPLNDDTATFLTNIRNQPDTANAITRSATTPGIKATLQASTNSG